MQRRRGLNAVRRRKKAYNSIIAVFLLLAGPDQETEELWRAMRVKWFQTAVNGHRKCLKVEGREEKDNQNITLEVESLRGKTHSLQTGKGGPKKNNLSSHSSTISGSMGKGKIAKRGKMGFLGGKLTTRLRIKNTTATHPV